MLRAFQVISGGTKGLFASVFLIGVVSAVLANIINNQVPSARRPPPMPAILAIKACCTAHTTPKHVQDEQRMGLNMTSTVRTQVAPFEVRLVAASSHVEHPCTLSNANMLSPFCGA